ncbi:MAG: LysM peptidoglycan-binding domain-containing protein [Limisphaerales bacterium]
MKQAKPMNQTTPLNSELLSADARGRKHIPVAVFAVIVIHVVLFLVLLIAAGCRSSARAKQSTTPQPEAAERNLTPPPATRMAAQPTMEETALPSEIGLAAEPANPVEAEPTVLAAPREVAQSTPSPSPTPAAKPAKAKVSASPKFYVVKAGDTVGEIAQRHSTTIQAIRTVNKIKNDMIYPGQKLQLAPEGRTAPLQVRSEKQKRSNDA